MGEPAAVAALGQQSEAFGRTVIGPAMGIVLIAGLWMAGQFGIPFTVALDCLGIGRLRCSLSSSGWSPSRQRPGAELGALARTAGGNDPRVTALRQRITVLSWLSLFVLGVGDLGDGPQAHDLTAPGPSSRN